MLSITLIWNRRNYDNLSFEEEADVLDKCIKAKLSREQNGEIKIARMVFVVKKLWYCGLRF